MRGEQGPEETEGVEEAVFWGPLAHTGLFPQACGPTLHRTCGKNMFAEGSCLLLGTHLQAIQTVPAAMAGRSPRDSDSVWSLCWHRGVGRVQDPGLGLLTHGPFPEASANPQWAGLAGRVAHNRSPKLVEG